MYDISLHLPGVRTGGAVYKQQQKTQLNTVSLVQRGGPCLYEERVIMMKAVKSNQNICILMPAVHLQHSSEDPIYNVTILKGVHYIFFKLTRHDEA